jgi:hypothetical protein
MQADANRPPMRCCRLPTVSPPREIAPFLRVNFG